MVDLCATHSEEFSTRTEEECARKTIAQHCTRTVRARIDDDDARAAAVVRRRRLRRRRIPTREERESRGGELLFTFRKKAHRRQRDFFQDITTCT